MWEQVKELLIGACDLHIHSGPDVAPRQQDIIELARDAAQAGMRALAIKDHNTITADRAALVHSVLGDSILVLGCIVLNYSVGGFNAEAVERGVAWGAPIWNTGTQGSTGRQTTHADHLRRPRSD